MPESGAPGVAEASPPGHRARALAVAGVPLAVLVGLTWRGLVALPAGTTPPATSIQGGWDVAKGALVGALGLWLALRRPRGLPPLRIPVSSALLGAGVALLAGDVLAGLAASVHRDPGPALGVAGLLGATGGGLLGAALCAWLNGRDVWATPVHTLLRVPVIVVSILLCSGAIVAVTQWGLRAFGRAPAVQPILESFRDESQATVAALYLVLFVVVAPLVEEGAFRGLVYRGLREWAGPTAAAVGSAALFAAVHAAPSHVPALFVMGWILAATVERTGSLVPGILIHAAWNAMASAASR